MIFFAAKKRCFFVPTKENTLQNAAICGKWAAKSKKNAGGRLKDVVFDKPDDFLQLGIGALGVVAAFKAGAEEGGKGLVERGAELAAEDDDEVVARLVAFAVDELNEHFALTERELLHAGGVGGHEVFFHLLHVALACLVVGQGLHVFVSLNDDAAYLLREGERLLDVTYVAPVLLFCTAVLELGRAVDIDVAHVDDGDGVAVVDIDRQGVVGIDLSGSYRSDNQQQQQGSEISFHAFHGANVTLLSCTQRTN